MNGSNEYVRGRDKDSLAHSTVLIAGPTTPGSALRRLVSFAEGRRRLESGRLMVVLHPLPHSLVRRTELSSVRGTAPVWRGRFPRGPQVPVISRFVDLVITCGFLVWARQRVDMYIGAGLHLVLLGILLRRAGVVKRTVAFAMDFWPHKYGGLLGRAYRALNAYCFSRADYLLSVSPVIIDACLKEGMKIDATRVIIVPHMVESAETGCAPDDELQPDSIVWTGGMAPEYGFELVIEAMQLVVEERPGALVDITSYGEIPHRLRRMIARRGLEPHFRILGFIRDEREFQRFVRKHRIGLAPYRPDPNSFKRYTDPSRVKDYMANGVPPIITRVPPVAEEIEEAGAGLVVDYDKAKLAQAILALLSDDELHRRCRGRGLQLVKKYEAKPLCLQVFTRLGMIDPEVAEGPAKPKASAVAVKHIFLEPCWKLPFSYEYMIGFPPDRYEYLTAGAPPEKFFKVISRWGLSYQALDSIDRALPSVLAMSWLQKHMKPPQGTILTWAHGHLVFRPEPWVVEVEYPSLLLGPRPRHLARFRGLVERMLASPFCRKIRVWSEAGRQAMLSQLDCTEFGDKIELIPHAVPVQPFVKEYGDGKIRLLHVGSANIKGAFETRGGRELLEAFRRLCAERDDVELVVRCDVPAYLKAKYARLPNLRIIDQVLSKAALEQEFRSADVFVWPAHSTSPFVLLEAMAHELPVVGVDFFATPELVAHGKTGLLVPPSQDGLRRPCRGVWGDVATPEIYAPRRKSDPEFVEQLLRQILRLTESPELRRRMGRAGRWEVEHGQFSIKKRNERLKRMFDEAIGDERH